MIGISTQVLDPAGTWIFDKIFAPVNRGGSRRVAYTGTLDGGVVVTDFGYADGDRTVIVQDDDPSRESVAFAQYIVENYTDIIVMMEDGAFLASPSDYNIDASGALKLNLHIKERLS